MRAKRILAAAALAAAALATQAFAADLTGAGSTFAYPIYSKWAEAYKQQTGVGLNYQSIGSGGGIKQIIAKTVDFGASDMPLTVDDLQKDGLQQFPTCIGGAIPTVNLKGVKPGELKLTGAVLGDISYSSYLLHFPLQLMAASVVVLAGLDRSSFLSVPVLAGFFLVLAALSYASYALLERPAQSFLRGARKKGRPRRSAASLSQGF